MSAAAVVVRWVSLTSLAVLLGAASLAVAVLPAAADEASAARLRAFAKLSAAVLLLASIAELLLRARTLSGGTARTAIAALPLVVLRTHFGAVWLARLAAVVALLAALAIRPPRWAVLALAAGVALTTSLTGHAADAGDFAPGVFVDWAHVVAAAAWAGGLVGLALVVLAGTARWAPSRVGQAARRFSRLAGVCLAVVAATGAYNAWAQMPALSAFVTTTYGRALLAKLVVVAALVAIGARNRFRAVPALARERVTDHALRAGFRRWVAAEAAFGIVVFACTAVLTEATPARHAGHERHGRAVAGPAGPFRVTMEELHEAGGVPAGWIFRPGAGDATRGRRLFATLGCFACHAVEGESFPPPTGPGPDLSDLGAHHPAGYIAESIMNPNAVIVQGPGYAGPTGLSVMPDYGDRLTVRDVDDLVAYLESL